MAYTVEIDYGSGWVDLTDYSTFGDIVLQDSFSKTTQLYNDQHKAVIGTANFKTELIESLAHTLLTLDFDTEIKCVIELDSTAWFTGYIRPVTDYRVDNAAKTIDFEVVDNLWRLKRKLSANIQKLPADSMVVCAAGGGATSLVHTLLTDAGYAGTVNGVDISNSIDYYRAVMGKDGKDILTLLDELLPMYHRAYYCNAAGEFCIVDWAPLSITPAGTFSTGTSGNIREGLTVSRKDKTDDHVQVNYYLTRTVRTIVGHYNEESDPNMFGLISGVGTVWPLGSNTYPNRKRFDFFLDKAIFPSTTYVAGRGTELFKQKTISIEGTDLRFYVPSLWYTNTNVKSPNHNTWYTDTFTYRLSDSPSLQFTLGTETYYNTGDANGSYAIVQGTLTREGTKYKALYITELDIWGNVTSLIGPISQITPSAGGVSPRVIDANNLFSEADAAELGQAEYIDLSIGAYKYSFTSLDYAEIGEYYTLADALNLNISTTVRITKRTVTQYGGVEIYVYEAQGAAVIGSVVEAITGGAISVTPTAPSIASATQAANNGLTPTGQVVQAIESHVISAGYVPQEDGLFLCNEYLGFYDADTPEWKAYIKNDGTFLFKGDANNYIEWDGATFSIHGDLFLSGDSELQGTVTTGNGIESDNFVTGTSGWQITGAGVAEFREGTIAGWSINGDTLESADGSVVLDKANKRVVINDTLGALTAAFGYLDGIGAYTSSDYGLYVSPGNNVHIEGGGEYVNGDYIIEHDAAYVVTDSDDEEVVRLGSLGGGDIGLIVGDTSTGNGLDFSVADGLTIKAKEIDVKAGDDDNFFELKSTGGLKIGEISPVTQGDALELPDGAEYWQFRDKYCRSNLGTSPASRVIKYQPGYIGSVENPWFYERKWTVPLGLVAAYTMNAGAGSVLRDDSGNFNSITLYGTPTWDASGHSGYCLSLNGTTQGGYIVGTCGISNASNYSMFEWVYISGVNIKGTFFSVGGNTNGISMGVGDSTIDNTGNHLIGLFCSARWIATGIDIGTGWHHVGMALDSNGYPHMYLDGVEVYTDTTANSITPTTQCHMGAEVTVGRYFPGKVDDARIYKRFVTEAEALSLYAETSPYEDVYAPPCDNAVWLGKTTTNLVASTDLDNSSWDKSTSFHTNYGNVFDSELQKTVWKWNKGSTANYTVVYDAGGLSSPAAGTYVMSFMVKCNYALSVVGYFYGSTPGSLFGGTQLIPADTWTLCTFRITTAVTTYTQPTFIMYLPGSGNFAADIEFRACDPYVALESYPMPFVPTTRPAGSLWYNFTWPQQGTVGFWVKPGFNWNTDFGGGANCVFLDTYRVTTTTRIQIAYVVASDYFWFSFWDNSGNQDFAYTNAIASNDDLQKWWFIGCTWDIPNDSLKIFAYSSNYPTGIGATQSTSDLGTHTIQPYLHIGGDALSSSAVHNQAQAFMAGLFIDDTVWTEATLAAHYATGRVYYDPEHQTDVIKGVSASKYALDLPGSSLLIDDQYDREIEISPQTGLMARDASGNIIHDIPTAKMLSNSYSMGHLYLLNNNYAAYTLELDSDVTLSSWVTVTALNIGNTNVKGIRVKVNLDTAGSAYAEGRTFISLRPKGSGYGTPSNEMAVTDFNQIRLSSSIITEMARTCILDVAVDENMQFEYYVVSDHTTSKILLIKQLGIWV